jgi:SSS family solute:Na+ symporter
MNFSTVDLVVFVGYILAIAGIGLYLSFNHKDKDAKDYFLASKALPWWAVGGSLIASNISAEQFIGMSGSGYVVGMAIASYELMAALTLVIIAKFFLPVFLEKNIYTMPQFLEERFDKRTRTGMAFFWVLLFIFVNITSVLYLGGLALYTIMGIKLSYGILFLALFAATFSIFGGLKAVVWTDVIQVVVLILGGLLASVLVLNAVGDGGVWQGFTTLLERAPEKFDMILDRSNAEFKNLPGISVLIGGMWIANLYYWGTNQYIIQRALAAKSLKEAQKGTVFAAFLKILLPLIVVVPGIAAFVLAADIAKPDEAYPWVLDNYVTVGFKGLAFAALIAAIGSSLSSMVNSTATIFTLDIYKPMMRDNVENPQQRLVWVGKLAAGISLVIGLLVAPLLGNIDQAFQYIQEYTGFISPGVVVIFLFGLFWKRASANAAFIVVLLSIPLSVAFKFGLPDFPFMNRMGASFLILSFLMIAISMLENKDDDAKAYVHRPGLFRTSPEFNLATLVICIILSVIYAVWW